MDSEAKAMLFNFMTGNTTIEEHDMLLEKMSQEKKDRFNIVLPSNEKAERNLSRLRYAMYQDVNNRIAIVDRRIREHFE